jgi:hypothetical protein
MDASGETLIDQLFTSYGLTDIVLNSVVDIAGEPGVTHLLSCKNSHFWRWRPLHTENI